MTDSDEDAFWLAQVHFQTGNYTRALGFLSRQDLIARNPSCKYLAGHCYIKQERYDEALDVLGDKNPVHLLSSSDRMRRKLQHVDIGNSSSSKRTKNPISRTDRIDRSEDRDREDINDVRFEAGMCYLRGLCFAKQNAFERAKNCYKDAVRIDVQCFEAFDQLMKNKLMSPSEEWAFLDSLDFDSISTSSTSSSGSVEDSASQEAAGFTKMLYTTRLSKYTRPDDFMAAIDTLSNGYNMSQNVTILLAKAELLFNNCRFGEACELTSSILEGDPYNFETIPVHVACLYEQRQTHALFLLSHDLADTHPEEPATWLAVGTYYMSIDSMAQARAYFSKASLADPHFGPAWIGFAHTFAVEGEHDQAISAYSTAARLFQGTHLPQLFLGMENLSLGNVALAREYFDAAHQMCSTDPLLFNDMGVTHYHEGELDKAERCFLLALEYAEEAGSGGNISNSAAWMQTHNNLAHTYRRQSPPRLQDALDEFEIVIRQGGRDAPTLTAMGLVQMQMQDWPGAAATLHEALAISPQDPMATELLSRTLENMNMAQELGMGDELADIRGETQRAAMAARAIKHSDRKGRRARATNSETHLTDSIMLES